MKRYRYSESFLSIQGEGHYIGAPSVFLRFWGCNFTCAGFSNPERSALDFDPADVPAWRTCPSSRGGAIRFMRGGGISSTCRSKRRQPNSAMPLKATARRFVIDGQGKVAYHGGAGPHFFDPDEWEQAIKTVAN